MGMLEVDRIATALLAAGMDPATPAAAVQWGTLPSQTSEMSTLEALPERVAARRMRPPGIIVVGKVAALGPRLGWYESLPLFGKRIVVTRARHQAAELADRLEADGALVVEYPVISIGAPDDPERVQRAYQTVSGYDWLMLTSVNGARRFFDGFLQAGHDLRELAGVSIAAIGSATAAAVTAYGIRVAAVPSEYRAEALVECLDDLRGRRVLVARAAVARDVLPDTLRARGAEVDVVAIYKTVDGEPGCSADELSTADVVTFTSSSTVERFVRLAGEPGRGLLARAVIAAIGPITADTLCDLGFEPQIVPARYTIDDLATAIVAFFANRQAST
jgi:uroporphyrinogen III methyltransferase/synthase